MKINVNGIIHKVNKVDNSNDNNMGRWVEKKALIEVDNSMDKQIQDLTIVHEVTHALLSSIGENELSRNEGFVEKLSFAFYNFIKDNKQFAKDME